MWLLIVTIYLICLLHDDSCKALNKLKYHAWSLCLATSFKCNGIVLLHLDFFLLHKRGCRFYPLVLLYKTLPFFLSFGHSFLSYWSALPLQSSAFARRSSFCPKVCQLLLFPFQLYIFFYLTVNFKKKIEMKP